MSIFERLHRKPKEQIDATAEASEEVKDKENDDVNPTSPAVSPEKEKITEERKMPRTIEDVKKAKEEIANLQKQRQELLQKIRDRKGDATALGIAQREGDIDSNGLTKDSRKRTETFSALMQPLEEELRQISGKISSLREEYDLYPKREEVLESRKNRLWQAAGEGYHQFDRATDSAKQIADLKKQLRFLERKENFGFDKNKAIMKVVGIRDKIDSLQESRNKFLASYVDDPVRKSKFELKLHILEKQLADAKKESDETQYDEFNTNKRRELEEQILKIQNSDEYKHQASSFDKQFNSDRAYSLRERTRDDINRQKYEEQR